MKDSIGRLINSLIEDSDPSVQIQAAEALGRLRDRRGLPALVETLRIGRASDVRQMAIAALSQIGGAEAREALVTLVSPGTDPESLMAALHGLGRLGGEVAFQVLCEVLSDIRYSGTVRGMAAEQLGHLGNRRAAPALLSALSDPVVDVRFWSAHALGLLGSRQAIPALESLADCDPGFLPDWGSVAGEAKAALASIHAS